MNMNSEDNAALLCLYLLDKIGSLLVFFVQFFCHLISFCLTGVTGVLFAGLSGSDYQRLKFSSTSAFDFANINLQERLSRPTMPLLWMQRAAQQTSRRSRQPRPSPFQPGSMSGPDWRQLVWSQLEHFRTAAACVLKSSLHERSCWRLRTSCCGSKDATAAQRYW